MSDVGACGLSGYCQCFLCSPLSIPALASQGGGQRRKSCAFASPFVMALLSPRAPQKQIGEGRARLPPSQVTGLSFASCQVES